MDPSLLHKELWNPALDIVLNQLQDRFGNGYWLVACGSVDEVKVLEARGEGSEWTTDRYEDMAQQLMKATESASGLARHTRRSDRPVSHVISKSYIAIRVRGVPGSTSVLLAVGSDSSIEYTEDDTRFVKDMAQLLSAPARMILLCDQLDTLQTIDVQARALQNHQRASCLEVMTYVTEAARTGLQFNQIVEGIVERLMEQLNVPYGAVYFDIDGNWILVKHFGLDERILLQGGVIPAPACEWTKNPEPQADFPTGEPLESVFEDIGIGSWAMVPLLRSGTITGGMLFASQTASVFDGPLLQGLARVSEALDTSMGQADQAYELAQQAEDLHAVLGSLTDALIEVTADRSIRQANKAAMQLLGVSLGHTGSDSWQSLVPLFDLQDDTPADDRHPLHLSFYDATAQSPSQWRLEVADKTVYVSTTSSPIVDEENGHVRAVVLVLRDVTEQRAKEQKLLSAEKHASISMLAAGVAHEFKNYLSGIIGNASLAEQRSGDAQRVEECMKRIVTIGGRANQTALALLSYVRNATDERQLVDMGALVGEVVCLVDERAAGQNVVIEREFQDDVCTDGEPSRLRQVVLNVLTNAVDAMPDGGSLNLSLSAEGDLINLTIADTGTGIAAENMAKVFDPFFSTKGVWGGESGSGTGLGLTTSLNYVRDLGGQLTLSSSPGEGTTVHIMLPLAKRAQTVASNDAAAAKNLNAVVVELDLETQNSIVAVLTSRGYKVVVCENAQDLTRQIESVHPGLAFIDTLMPGKINFIRCYETIQDHCPGCSIVVNTAEATDYQLDEYVRSAHGRLVKPAGEKAIDALISRLPGVQSVPA